ncbi:MAG: sugar-transfer associated ATP-grasp domain-containing protein [Paracoccaceae bacterium]
MAEAHEKILTDRRTMPPVAIAELVKKAAAREGIGPGRIFREMVQLGLGKNRIGQREYFSNHLYRPALSMEQKREFIGEKANHRLNLRLSPPDLTRMRGFLNDKIAHSTLWRSWGISTTGTQAVYTSDRWLGPTPVLRNADAILGFLKNDAVFPLFGKPVEGLQALGSVYVDAIDAAAGSAQLLNGETIELSRLAEEIVRDFPEGYMFQHAVQQHPDVSEIFGPALSCIRMVTVIEDRAPTVLYAYWKIAAFHGMSDNFWQNGTMLALIDTEDGVVRNCVTGKGPEEEQVETHPVSGRQIAGYRIPFWEEAAQMAETAHSIFPVNGCLGWDVAIGPAGPVLIECNDNTGHNTYQIVLGRGALNPDLMARFERVIARNKRIADGRRARAYKFDV